MKGHSQFSTFFNVDKEWATMLTIFRIPSLPESVQKMSIFSWHFSSKMYGITGQHMYSIYNKMIWLNRDLLALVKFISQLFLVL